MDPEYINNHIKLDDPIHKWNTTKIIRCEFDAQRCFNYIRDNIEKFIKVPTLDNFYFPLLVF